MPDDQTQIILSALRSYCHESNESFYTISENIGVSYASLSHWMLHYVKPTAARLRKIRVFIRKYGVGYL
jgi:hypothetical protein